MLFLGQLEDAGLHPSCCDHPGASGKPHTVGVYACMPVWTQRPGLGPLCITSLRLASLKFQPAARTATGKPQQLLFPGCARVMGAKIQTQGPHSLSHHL